MATTEELDTADTFVSRTFAAGKEAMVEIKDLDPDGTAFGGTIEIGYRYEADPADEWRTIYAKAWADVLEFGGDSAVIYVDIPDRPINFRAGVTGSVTGSAEFRV